jgi:hypothetical protein
VLYIPNHAFGDLNHKDIEQGFITSFNDHNVFVRYGDELRSKATYRGDLVWLTVARAAIRIQK